MRAGGTERGGEGEPETARLLDAVQLRRERHPHAGKTSSSAREPHFDTTTFSAEPPEEGSTFTLIAQVRM